MPKSRGSDITNFSSLFEITTSKPNVELQETTKVRTRQPVSIAEFNKLKDLPAWFRSLSNSQISAANSLMEAIRDDMDQNTTHRCRIALLRLGLYPLEPSKNIKFVIHLSRGNDLAFLWFLMELFYKDTCSECDHEKTEYNINEQLLMSGVAHLDMVYTLRELDKIVPRPPVPEPKKRPLIVKRKKKTYLSPFLEPLPRPKIGESLKKRPPLSKIQTLRYAHLCNDPNYTPPNAWNRWYARPKEQIGNLDFGFDEIAGAKAIVSRILKDQLNSIFTGTSERTKIWRSLCATHLKRKEEEKEKNKIEKVKHRDEARKHLSSRERKKMRSIRIGKQIEEDAKIVQDERNERREYQELQTWIKCFIDNLVWAATIPEIKKQICSLDGPCPIEEVHAGCLEDKEKQSQKQNCDCYLTCNKDPFDFGHYGRPKANEIYFHAQGQNKPYSFDYFKIFKDDLAEKEDPVKLAVNKALDLDKFADEDDAINSWIKSMWEEEVKKFNKEYNRKEEESKKPPPIINPNKEQMDQILEDAFKILKENPKFVFAALPQAHKHPSVRVWLRDRFNVLKVSDKERLETLRMSKRMLRKISNQPYKIYAPRDEAIGTEKIVSYKLRNYVYCKTKRVLQKFYHGYKALYLNDVRTYWQLMEHRHCSYPPYKMFYAYMPAREYDIIPFRPWKTSEFMDAKAAFVKRQLKKKIEAKYKL